MPKNSKQHSGLTQRQTTALLTIVGIIVLIVAGWLWWQNVYSTPERVFWSMVNNNLVTTGITKHSTQSGQQAPTTTDQYTRLTFGSQNTVRSIVTLTQDDGTNKSVVKTETIGTPDNDFARYLSINTTQKSSEGKLLDFTKIQGIWGKSPDPVAGQPSTASYLRQAVLGLVPFGYLDSENRASIVSYMQNNQVYKPDFSHVQKTTKNGKAVYIYAVEVQPKAYANLLVMMNKAMGLGAIDGLDPSAYESSPPIKTQFTVDKNSRQLVSISYVGSGQEEAYSDYGLSLPLILPTQTIPIAELQKRIQTVQ